MTPLISKRHRLKFYLTIILGTLVYLGLGIALLIISFRHENGSAMKLKEQLMPLFGIGCLLLAFYTVYKYYKNAPRIRMDDLSISFNDQTFSFSDLECIELTGKRNFPYLTTFPMEATTLQFKDGQTKYIFDDMYENSWKLKSFLKNVVIDKKELALITNPPIDNNSVATDFYETFKGNQITSLRGISLWGLIGLFAYMIINNERPNTVGLTMIFLTFSTFLFVLFSYQMHYFQISDEYFLVRNHNFFWKKKVYNLSDVEEVVFETQGKMPNCLRVITKDFRNELYPAGTLRDKTWLELKDRLEAHDIKVRNECI